MVQTRGSDLSVILMGETRGLFSVDQKTELIFHMVIVIS